MRGPPSPRERETGPQHHISHLWVSQAPICVAAIACCETGGVIVQETVVDHLSSQKMFVTTEDVGMVGDPGTGLMTHCQGPIAGHCPV